LGGHGPYSQGLQEMQIVDRADGTAPTTSMVTWNLCAATVSTESYR
jgi:hypothetical protein